MHCERYRDALTDVAAGAPAPAGLEAHLDSCETCREELAARRRALAIAGAEMARFGAAEPSPGLTARIREAVAEADAAPPWHLGWVWPAMVASVILLAALAAWTIRAPSPARVVMDGRPAAAPTESRPAGEPRRTSEAPERTAPSPRAHAFVPAHGGSATASVRHRPPPPPAAAEVLVPPGEAEALARFAAIVRRDRHAPGALAASGWPSPALAEPAELVIKPLEIVPLDPAETPGT